MVDRGDWPSGQAVLYHSSVHRLRFYVVAAVAVVAGLVLAVAALASGSIDPLGRVFLPLVGAGLIAFGCSLWRSPGITVTVTQNEIRASGPLGRDRALSVRKVMSVGVGPPTTRGESLRRGFFRDYSQREAFAFCVGHNPVVIVHAEEEDPLMMSADDPEACAAVIYSLTHP